MSNRSHTRRRTSAASAALALGVSLVVAVASPASAAPTLDQAIAQDWSSTTFFYDGSVLQQTFIAGRSGSLTSVVFEEIGTGGIVNILNNGASSQVIGTTSVGSATGLAAFPTPVPVIAGEQCTVTGLTNGEEYTFRATASNVLGTSAESVASNPATPVFTPGTPTLSAESPNNEITLDWTAPTETGGLPITGYDIRYRALGDPTWVAGPTGVSSPTTVSGPES